MITLSSKGDFKKTFEYLNKSNGLFGRVANSIMESKLNKYGQKGVDALKEATPFDTGATAYSWYYEIERTDDSISIIWSNSNENRTIPIVILLQYGHLTKNGYRVEGIDFINPALKPIFDDLADEIWKEVTNNV